MMLARMGSDADASAVSDWLDEIGNKRLDRIKELETQLAVMPQYVNQCAKLLEDNDILRHRAGAAEARVRELAQKLDNAEKMAALTPDDLYVSAYAIPVSETEQRAVVERDAAIKRAKAAEAMIEEIRRHVPVRDFAEAQYRAQWLIMAADAEHLRK